MNDQNYGYKHLTMNADAFKNDPNDNGLFFLIPEKTSEVFVTVYEHERSTKIKNRIPLRKFSKYFREMYHSGLFTKVYMNYDELTAKSIHNTYFAPEIK